MQRKMWKLLFSTLNIAQNDYTARYTCCGLFQHISNQIVPAMHQKQQGETICSPIQRGKFDPFIIIIGLSALRSILY
jgi:hypothetical protein